MKTIRIPSRYKKQLFRLSDKKRLWVFDAMFRLSSGEFIDLPDNIEGDILELIWRDCVQMAKKSRDRGDSEEVGGFTSVSATYSPTEGKGKEGKGTEGKGIPPTPTGEKSGFEKFWILYPKKSGKGAAENAWRKIKQPIQTLEIIEKSLKWQISSEQWSKDRGQFIPLPATYLNQKRWLDEPLKLEIQKLEAPKPKIYSRP